MEIELKFRLNATSYLKLTQLLSQKATLKSIDFQTNYFLDSNNELENKRITFRSRRVAETIQGKETIKSFLTIKGKAKNGISTHQITNGISKVEELETQIENEDFESIISNPQGIFDFQDKYDLIPIVKNEFVAPINMEIIGQFENKRMNYDWQGLFLELDETTYPFGNAYELEVEHSNPIETKITLENLLKDNGIDFTYSKRSKFGNMKSKEIL